MTEDPRFTTPHEPDWVVADHADDLDEWHRWIIACREAVLYGDEVPNTIPDTVFQRDAEWRAAKSRHPSYA